MRNLTNVTGDDMQTQDAISTRIDAMPFSTRVSNALRLMKIERIGDLAGLSEAYLMHSPNIGRKSLYEIKDALAEFGLTLGMVFDSPPEITNQRPAPVDRTVDDWIVRCTAKRLPFLEQASRDGYSSADVHLGRIYLEGVGIRCDYRKARLFFIRAARRGNALGYWNLALMYRIGYGVRRSASKVARWSRQYEAILSSRAER
jgi:TPR repeat protein